MRGVVVFVGLLMTLAGCGTSTVVSVQDDPVPSPYDGPMSVPADPGDEEKPVLERSGAAGLALECDGAPYNGGTSDYVEGDLYEIADTPERALENYLDGEGPVYMLPTAGYRFEREDDGRVLFSYDVGRRTKVAFIVADGVRNYDDETGWGVETWAQCDPAELPDEFTEQADIRVWTDEEGRRVPTTSIKSFHGAEHCDWQDITFIHLGPPERLQQFVGEGAGELGDLLRSTYDGSAKLPDHATDTGFRREGRELWVTEERDAAYLVSVDDPNDVERWPAAEEPILCA